MSTCPRCGLQKVECEGRRDDRTLACHLLNARCPECDELERVCRARRANDEVPCHLFNPPVVAEDVQ